MGIFIALAVAAYAIDRANSGKIADGIRIGGVNVGGMSSDQAKSHLQLFGDRADILRASVDFVLDRRS